MNNSILMELEWEDIDFDIWNVECSSPNAFAKTKIYISRSEMISFAENLLVYLEGDEKTYSFSSPTVNMCFKRIDTLGHFKVDCYLILEDGKDSSNYHCFFEVSMEYGLIMQLSQSILGMCR